MTYSTRNILALICGGVLGIILTLILSRVVTVDDVREPARKPLTPFEGAQQQPESDTDSGQDLVRELTWEELIPGDGLEQQQQYNAGSEHYLFEDESWQQGSQGQTYSSGFPSNVVEELDGVHAKIPGFAVPLELGEDGKVSEFLLVPYFGACIHYPPPPSNQIVYVIFENPIELKSVWEPIWAVGVLKTEFRSSGFGSASYTMTAQAVEEYEY